MGKIGWQERENVKRRETDMFLFFIIPTYANGNPAFQPEFVRFRAEFVLVRLDLSDPVATFAQTWCHMLLRRADDSIGICENTEDSLLEVW
jgi:hypothetical protein